MDEIEQIMASAARGESGAVSRLYTVVYDELRRLAAAKLAREKPGHTLQTTALVHEAYLRLVGPWGCVESAASSDAKAGPRWHSRGHFFAAAAEAMRRILVESARRKRRLKRGGDWSKLNLEVAEIAVEPPSDDLLALDDAIRKLEQTDKTKADVVKLRYFAGLSIDDTAATLGVSAPTVKRYWAYARAWLLREISKGDAPPA